MLKWYRVHFKATKSDGRRIGQVRFDRKIQAVSPVQAIQEVVRQQYHYAAGIVTEWVIDGDVEIPTRWEFDEDDSDHVWDFLITIDERDAVLDEMVSELEPAEELRMAGVPGLFD